MSDLTPSTFNLGLIGYPISNSVSPQIHSTALKEVGLDGEYKLYPIEPDDKQGLVDLLTKVRIAEIHGLNVTIPHKQNVMLLLDELTPTAEAIGAVNTIAFKDDKLVGDNTDANGFWNDLQILVHGRHGKARKLKALILGAGGSARAVTYALLKHGWDVAISTRRIEQAEELAQQFPTPNSQLTAISYDAPTLHSLLPTFHLIVNTTPVGMTSHPQGSPWIEGLPFPPKAALYDLIYNPTETQLMKDAVQAGLPVRNGLGMLIGQALLSFEIWTGHKVPADKIDLNL